jgi:hypothetical protein
MDYYDLLDDKTNNDDISGNSKCINLDIKHNSELLLDKDLHLNDKQIESSENKLIQINKLSQSTRKIKKPTKKRIKTTIDTIPPKQTKSILSFFSQQKQEQKKDMSEIQQTTKITDSEINTQEQQEQNIVKVVSNRATLNDLYMSIIDKKHISTKTRINYIKLCTVCEIEKTLIQSEGIYVCKKCGEVEHVIIESEIPNHKDAGNEKPRTPYKKQTHLAETLNQFQAKESTEIPNRVYTKILIELKKKKISIDELSSMKYAKAKELIKCILKRLQFSSYYEHIPYILSKLTNKPAPTISRETEEKIKKMFKLSEIAFEKFCPPDRKNYINYSFVFHKFFQILDMIEFAECFPLLKSPDKLKKADQLWEKICEYNNWPFFPSS